MKRNVILHQTDTKVVTDGELIQSFAFAAWSEHQERPPQMSQGFRTPEERRHAIQQAGLLDTASPQPMSDEQLVMLGIDPDGID